jgi:hypothetical protein
VVRVIDRAELEARVRHRLLKDGTEPGLVERVIRPGFFPSGDKALVELGRKLGIVADDEELAGAPRE